MDKPASNFDISPEMREFAEKSVQQARQAFDGFIAAARHAVTTAETQAINARTGAREAADLAMRFAERNVASSFELAQKLMQAKDLQAVLAIHGEYVKKQMEVLTEQARELSQTAGKMAGR
jgi:phasin